MAHPTIQSLFSVVCLLSVTTVRAQVRCPDLTPPRTCIKFYSPHTCEEYYQCTLGQERGQRFSCPSPLTFNPETGVCDLWNKCAGKQNPCDNTRCQHGGVCLVSDAGSMFMCACRSGYGGYRCETDLNVYWIFFAGALVVGVILVVFVLNVFVFDNVQWRPRRLCSDKLHHMLHQKQPKQSKAQPCDHTDEIQQGENSKPAPRPSQQQRQRLQLTVPGLPMLKINF
ncbi:fibropellin-1-like [Littorina saxatilis]|uniref:fibropellin-1-like n=1 Tax=Littorina saxatilis TaxID=31220 RepID=UPI0038B5E841